MQRLTSVINNSTPRTRQIKSGDIVMILPFHTLGIPLWYLVRRDYVTVILCKPETVFVFSIVECHIVLFVLSYSYASLEHIGKQF